ERLDVVGRGGAADLPGASALRRVRAGRRTPRAALHGPPVEEGVSLSRDPPGRPYARGGGAGHGPALPAQAVGKRRRIPQARPGSRAAADQARYPKNDGIFTPACSAIAFTMKFGPLPM